MPSISPLQSTHLSTRRPKPDNDANTHVGDFLAPCADGSRRLLRCSYGARGIKSTHFSSLPAHRPCKLLPIRLNPGADLRAAFEQLVRQHGDHAGFVISAIGSLDDAVLRFAGASRPVTLEGPMEILSLAGSVTADERVFCICGYRIGKGGCGEGIRAGEYRAHDGGSAASGAPGMVVDGNSIPAPVIPSWCCSAAR